jgi:hypothetical protein
MIMIENIKTGIQNALKDPLGTSLGVAWWILCVGVGAWLLQGALSFVMRLNGL